MIILRVVDLTVELTDLATEITKYANLRTHTQDNKQLFQIIGQIHVATEYRSFHLVVLLLAGSSRF